LLWEQQEEKKILEAIDKTHTRMKVNSGAFAEWKK
jgi:hypothetical protein